MKLSFIGLGVMGYPMAGHLKRAGHDLTVYNRTSSRAGDWVKEFGGDLRIGNANPGTFVEVTVPIEPLARDSQNGTAGLNRPAHREVAL